MTMIATMIKKLFFCCKRRQGEENLPLRQQQQFPFPQPAPPLHPRIVPPSSSQATSSTPYRSGVNTITNYNTFNAKISNVYICNYR